MGRCPSLAPPRESKDRKAFSLAAKSAFANAIAASSSTGSCSMAAALLWRRRDEAGVCKAPAPRVPWVLLWPGVVLAVPDFRPSCRRVASGGGAGSKCRSIFGKYSCDRCDGVWNGVVPVLPNSMGEVVLRLTGVTGWSASASGRRNGMVRVWATAPPSVRCAPGPPSGATRCTG